MALATLTVFTLFQGCGNDDKLSSDETLQALLRARWSAAMINQGRQIVEPLQELPEEFSQAELESTLNDAFGPCYALHPDLEGDTTRWGIELDAACEQTPPHCTGSFRIAPQSTDEDGSTAHWIAVDALALECGDTMIDQGHVAFRGRAATTNQPFTLEMKLRDFSYTASRVKDEIEDIYLAANNFQGHVLLRHEPVTTRDEQTLEDTVIVVGEASFSDEEIEPLWEWAVDFQEVALYEWSATPRGGTLQLRTIHDNSYNFITEWIPLTLLSTQPTIKHGKHVWVGCVSHDNSDACNQRAP